MKHKASECRFKEVACRACGKVGHIARVCHPKGGKHERKMPNGRCNTLQHTRKSLPYSGQSAEQPETKGTEYDTLYSITGLKSKPYSIQLLLNRRELTMEVDTSASLSLISETTYNTLWPANSAPPLHHGNRFKSWLQKLKLNWKQTFHVHHQEQLP